MNVYCCHVFQYHHKKKMILMHERTKLFRYVSLKIRPRKTLKWHFFSGSVLKKQKTKCIDQYDQTSSIEFLIFPNSIDDEKSFPVTFHFLFTNGKDVRYMIFYIWWVKIIWYDDLNMLLSRSLLLYMKYYYIQFSTAKVILLFRIFCTLWIWYVLQQNIKVFINSNFSLLELYSFVNQWKNILFTNR